ncbi:HlyD family efflux transporter periplasmic adaptor subunit [Rhodovarius crocodyli]|uniref:HlyD family efflux transporter periplasmic adaptor subunit n=1 Tax=Rhodovarius crocodyli TaxID=1979269 RepID=A0A437MFG9_9PROT|nr:HlyD family efflux transporter periplasmic adaptor subunit [Rhodovarius crocodyli]RVT96377.1 HlyD family efflux transporter periplasmic adaptor subunit [Rhodovarius crocodyli]
MKRSKLMIVLAVAGVAVAAGATWKLTAQEARPPGPPPAPPVVASLPRSLAGVGVGALGRVEPASRIRRLAAPGGMNVNRLSKLLVAEGDVVTEGQLLAEFADAPLKDAEVLRAEAALAEQRASLDRTVAAGRPSEIAAQRARIQALTSAAEIARRDASRTDRLVPSGAGAEAVAERNRFAAQRAAAEQSEAQAALETLSSARREDVQLAESRVANAEATLAKAIADAALSRVYAPIAGTILRIHARTGDAVGNDGVLEMADLTRIDVVAEVYETDVPRLSVGLPAEIVVPGESRRYAATLREIGWQVRRTAQSGTDPVAAVDARTLEVRLTLSEEARVALARRSNMQVQVAIRPPERAD